MAQALYIVEGVFFGVYYVMVILSANALLAKPAVEQNPLNRSIQKIILCCGALNLVRAVDMDGAMEILNWQFLNIISVNTTLLILLMLILALFAMLNMAYGTARQQGESVRIRHCLFVFWGISATLVNALCFVAFLHDVLWPLAISLALVAFDTMVLVLLYNFSALRVARYFTQVSTATRTLLSQPDRQDVISNALCRLKMVQVALLIMGAAAVAIFTLEAYTLLALGFNAHASARYKPRFEFQIVQPSVIMQAVLIGANLWAVWDGAACCTGRYDSTVIPSASDLGVGAGVGDEASYEPPTTPATPTFQHIQTSRGYSIHPSMDLGHAGLPPRMSPLTSSFGLRMPNYYAGFPSVVHSGTPVVGTPVFGRTGRDTLHSSFPK